MRERAAMRDEVRAAGCLMPVVVLAAAAALVTVARSDPAAAAAAPAVLDRLAGAWDGKGELFGKPAIFRMEWSRLGDRFVRLEFSNAFAAAAPEADPIPVLQATAVYRVGAPEMSGTWFDSRGMELPLAAAVSGSTLVVRWGAEGDAEQGRTTYRWTGPGTAHVTDEVLKDGAYRTFATADYWRPAPAAGDTPASRARP
jgi:hypothetical protein